MSKICFKEKEKKIDLHLIYAVLADEVRARRFRKIHLLCENRFRINIGYFALLNT